MWKAKVELRSSISATSALNYISISSGPIKFFFFFLSVTKRTCSIEKVKVQKRRQSWLSFFMDPQKMADFRSCTWQGCVLDSETLVFSVFLQMLSSLRHVSDICQSCFIEVASLEYWGRGQS